MSTNVDNRPRGLQLLDTWSSWLARAIAIIGFFVLLVSSVTPVIQEYLAGVVVRSETFTTVSSRQVLLVQRGVAELVGSRLRSGSGSRRERRRVDFDTPFPTTPTVSVGLTTIDADSTVRLRLAILNVDERGFDYEISTWRNSFVYAADFHWIAIGFDDQEASAM